MSRVSQNYSDIPSQNTVLAGLPVEEGLTNYEDLNNFIRQLMADAKQESDEVRSLVSGLSVQTSQAVSDASEATQTATDAATYAANMDERLSAAEATADGALEAATGFLGSDSFYSAVAGVTAASIASLQSRVNTLENPVGTPSTVSGDSYTTAVDGALLTVKDIAVEGDLTDLASARGQIGRTAEVASGSVDDIIRDGWYAIGSSATDKPTGVTTGVLRVSSSAASGSAVQTFISDGASPQVFLRATSDGGANWTVWSEAVFAQHLGDGLSMINGVLTVDFPEELPAVTDDDEDKVLGSNGEWVFRATQADIELLQDAITALNESQAAVETRMTVVEASTGRQPDGETVVLNDDGEYAVPLYLGATDEADGVSGLVPPADSEDRALFLRGDASWADPLTALPDYVGATDEEAGTSGYVPAAGVEEKDLFLKGDGTWADPSEAVADDLNLLDQRVVALESADAGALADRIYAVEQIAASVENSQEISNANASSALATANSFESRVTALETPLASSDIAAIFEGDI